MSIINDYEINYFGVKVNLNGERITSFLYVWRLKYEAPTLAEIKKNIETERIDRKVNIQDIGVKILIRFHTGDFGSGYLEYQYIGRYRDPGEHTPTVPRSRKQA